jgi:hypothetical protein
MRLGCSALSSVVLLFFASFPAKANAAGPFYSQPYMARQPVCQVQATESVLYGVNIYTDTIGEVIQRLGEPTRAYALDVENLRTRAYEWETETWRMRVVTATSQWRTAIYSVDVWGDRMYGQIGTSGQGLRLGDGLRDAYRIYGCSFSEWVHPIPFGPCSRFHMIVNTP